MSQSITHSLETLFVEQTRLHRVFKFTIPSNFTDKMTILVFYEVLCVTCSTALQTYHRRSTCVCGSTEPRSSPNSKIL